MVERLMLLVLWIWLFVSVFIVHGSAEEFASHGFTLSFIRERRGMLAATSPESSQHLPLKVRFPRKGPALESTRTPIQSALAPWGSARYHHVHTRTHGFAASPKLPHHRHHHHVKGKHKNGFPGPLHHHPAHIYGHQGMGPAAAESPQQFPSGSHGLPLPSPSPLPMVSSSQHSRYALQPGAPPSSPPSSISVLPPPNEDCTSISCTKPLTYKPAGYPCGCVWPIQVRLRLEVPLYIFFPLVSKLAEEIATSLSLNKGQVRIVGAEAASQEQLQRTAVLVHLVPTETKFRYSVAFSTYEKFWLKQVHISSSLFGAYHVMYVKYPGLPPSPPSVVPNLGSIDNHPYPVNESPPKPLGAAIPKIQNNAPDKRVILVIILSSVTASAVCIILAWLLLLKCQSSCHQPEQNSSMSSLTKPSGAAAKSLELRSKSSFGTMSLDSDIWTFTGSAKFFSLREMEKATDGFNSSNVLGEGGFGLVYSGILDDGQKVAVKVLKRDDRQGGREFLAEVEMLSRLHHRNLVKLIGICREDHLYCLVYELVPNGSVESHLHGADRDVAPLVWGIRMKIALGAARGLAYLHEDSSPCVIHRDFKASNILLEDDFTPKVSDFGLARNALNEATPRISTHVMGTFGYLAPEYAMTGHLLVKSDVYSYGVVLLELLTGRKPVDFSQPSGQENLVAWALPHLTSCQELETIIDSSLKPSVPSLESFAKVAAIASMCVQPEASRRPFMGEVVQALKLVCNEFELTVDTNNDEGENEDGSRRSKSLEHLFNDLESSSGSRFSGEFERFFGSYHHPVLGSESSCERKVTLSATDLVSASVGFEEEYHPSFRRDFSSGPLTMGGNRRFWKRLKGFSRVRMSEHAVSNRPWPGSH